MNIQLTISLLVSDRMETLEKCLSSLKPLLRELDSELIAVYTGKSNETLKLVQQYAALVIPFTWCDDFAKARNAGLKHAKGEWFLYIDDDEWFDNTEEIIQFFKSGEYKQYQSAYYLQRNYTDWEGKSYYDAAVGRMCRLTKDTRFILPIHEYLDPAPEPHKDFQCFVHHFGYVATSQNGSQRGEKTDRNIPLLLKRLEEGEDFDAFHCCMQLSQEYRNCKDYDTAIKYCEKGLKLACMHKTIYAPEIWMQAHLTTLISLTGDYRRALERGERLLMSPRVLEVPAAHIMVVLISLCYDLKEYRKGLKYVKLFHQKMAFLKKHPEKTQIQKGGDVTFSYVEGRAVPAYVNGLVFASEIGETSMIKTLLSWLPWEDSVSVAAFYPNLEGWKTAYGDQKEIILCGYASLRTENTYVNFQKALYAEKCGRKHEAENFWNFCIRNCPELLVCQAVEMAVRNHFLMNAFVEGMTSETWDNCARMLTGRIPLTDMDSFYENIVPLLKDYPLCASKLEQYFLERQLSQGLLEHSELVKLLHRYCENLTSAARKIYRDEVLSGSEVYALPSRYRFAFLIDKVLGLIECGGFAECILLLKEAFHIQPEMSIVVGQLTRYLTEQIEMPPHIVSKEFELLGGQVKQVLTGLMENRQWQEAYGVTGRLVTLLPDDLEVLRMKQNVLREGQ